MLWRDILQFSDIALQGSAGENESECDSASEDEGEQEQAYLHEARRWSVVESTLKGGLEEWIAAAARQAHARPYLRVAELLRQRGVISLSNEAWPAFEASPDRPPCHPSRFIEKLLRTYVPVGREHRPASFPPGQSAGWRCPP